jgi:type III pantothenate kinase
MLLAIDAGNTNVTFALYDGQIRKADWRIRTRPGRTSDEFAALLSNLFAGRSVSFAQIDGCVLSSVVPPATADLLRLCREHFSAEPVVASTSLDLGLDVRYRLEDLGPDRLVDASMALHRYGPAPLIFVDLGTGTTFNAIAAPNIYLGGAIFPGLGLAWDAMFERAALLHRVEAAIPPSPLADNTQHALQSGMVYGGASLIDGMVRRLQHVMDAPNCPVIATGGYLNDPLIAACETITHTDPFLTLDGLALVYSMVKGQE